jgi:GTPase SAR1 family protein
MQPQDIKKKIGRFRILVVGRANAGKTTLLQRVCNTTENPEVFDGAGNKVNTAFCVASESPTDQSDQIDSAIVKSSVYVCPHTC